MDPELTITFLCAVGVLCCFVQILPALILLVIILEQTFGDLVAAVPL